MFTKRLLKKCMILFATLLLLFSMFNVSAYGRDIIIRPKAKVHIETEGLSGDLPFRLFKHNTIAAENGAVTVNVMAEGITCNSVGFKIKYDGDLVNDPVLIDPSNSLCYDAKLIINNKADEAVALYNGAIEIPSGTPQKLFSFSFETKGEGTFYVELTDNLDTYTNGTATSLLVFTNNSLDKLLEPTIIPYLYDSAYDNPIKVAVTDKNRVVYITDKYLDDPVFGYAIYSSVLGMDRPLTDCYYDRNYGGYFYNTIQNDFTSYKFKLFSYSRPVKVISFSKDEDAYLLRKSLPRQLSLRDDQKTIPASDMTRKLYIGGYFGDGLGVHAESLSGKLLGFTGIAPDLTPVLKDNSMTFEYYSEDSAYMHLSSALPYHYNGYMVYIYKGHKLVGYQTFLTNDHNGDATGTISNPGFSYIFRTGNISDLDEFRGTFSDPYNETILGGYITLKHDKNGWYNGTSFQTHFNDSCLLGPVVMQGANPTNWTYDTSSITFPDGNYTVGLAINDGFLNYNAYEQTFIVDQVPKPWDDDYDEDVDLKDVTYTSRDYGKKGIDLPDYNSDYIVDIVDIILHIENVE